MYYFGRFASGVDWKSSDFFTMTPRQGFIQASTQLGLPEAKTKS